MVDRDYKVLKYFEAWMQLINPLHGDADGKAHNQVMTLNYPKDYKCTMSIVKFNKDYFRRGGAYVYYCYIRSWPLSISSVPVNYDSGSVLKLNVTFRYERYVMENVTRGMIRSGWKGYSDSFDPWLGSFPQVDKRLNPEDYKVEEVVNLDQKVESSVQNDDGGIYDGKNTIKYPNNWNKTVRSDGSDIPFWPWNWTQEDVDLLFGD